VDRSRSKLSDLDNPANPLGYRSATSTKPKPINLRRGRRRQEETMKPVHTHHHRDGTKTVGCDCQEMTSYTLEFCDVKILITKDQYDAIDAFVRKDPEYIPYWLCFEETDPEEPAIAQTRVMPKFYKTESEPTSYRPPDPKPVPTWERILEEILELLGLERRR
jgi:hypothetical protein